MHEYWQRQSEDTPLFPDILWSRPESKSSSGRLTIIGGNLHGFGAPGIAYSSSREARVGDARVLLPDAVKKIVKGILPDADFAPSTPSGSFSKQALGDLLAASHHSDAALVAGDIGRNSETAILLESYVSSYSGLLCVTQDAVDYFREIPLQLMNRANTLVVLTLSQLQKCFINTPTIIPITYSMNTQQLVEALHNYTMEHGVCLVTKHNDLLFIAQDGTVVTHKCEDKIWRIKTAARASVFWLQNPSKQFEAVVSSLVTDI